jgi:large subunit ribosomal protein L25
MEKIELKAQKRKVLGRKVNKLRREGIIPANIYGSGFKSESIQVNFKDFAAIYKKAGETSVVEVTLDGEKKELPVLIHNVQTDPISDLPIHVDFLKIDLTKKVTADVPLELIGEAPAEKQGIGTLVQYLDEIEVEALPGDLPEKITVDVSGLSEVDQSIMLKDLTYDKTKVDIKENPEEVVAKIEIQKAEAVEAPPVVPEGGVPAEGEVPAEGQAPTEEGAPKEEAPVEEKKE